MEMKITSNKSKRTFTVKYGEVKMTTIQLTREEFEDMDNATPEDFKGIYFKQDIWK